MITSSFSMALNGKALLNNSKEMLWQRNIYQVTTSTDGHGSITASPMSGYQGTTVSLSNTPNAGYNFNNYELTGASLTGSNFIMNNDVTAHAGFVHEPVRVPLSGVLSQVPTLTVYDNGRISNPLPDWSISVPANNYALSTACPIITQFNNQPMNTATLMKYSSYYDSITRETWGYPYYRADGLNKEIVITALGFGQSLDARFASATSVPYSQMYTFNTVSAGLHTDNIIGVRVEPIGYATTYDFDYTWFEGYLLE